jgi:hypothetical protein
LNGKMKRGVSTESSAGIDVKLGGNAKLEDIKRASFSGDMQNGFVIKGFRIEGIIVFEKTAKTGKIIPTGTFENRRHDNGRKR